MLQYSSISGEVCAFERVRRMTIEQLKAASHKVAGVKQTARALQKDSAEMVFIAEDADERIITPIVEASTAKQVPCIKVSTMQELGKVCGIHAGAAAAAILKS